MLHQSLHLGEIGTAELVPFRHDEKRIDILECVVARPVEADSAPKECFDRRNRNRIVGFHFHAHLEQPADDRQRRGVADVIGLRLERKTPESHRPALKPVLEMACELPQDDRFLALVDLIDSAEDPEAIATLLGCFDERFDVLRQARAPIANAREQEELPDARIGSDPLPHQIDIRADGLAEVCQLVHERDLRREERVRGVLRHLRALFIHNQYRVARSDERLEELLENLDGLLAL